MISGRPVRWSRGAAEASRRDVRRRGRDQHRRHRGRAAQGVETQLRHHQLRGALLPPVEEAQGEMR
jgi:hypothetical protein